MTRENKLEVIIQDILTYHNSFKLSDPIAIMVSSDCRVADDRKIWFGDIFYANYLPLEYEDIKAFIKQYSLNSRYKQVFDKFNSEEILKWFYATDVFISDHGLQDNYALKVKLMSHRELHHLFKSEYTILSKDKLDSLIESEMYDFYEEFKSFDETQEKPDIREGFTFADEDQRDIYGSAILDGASPSQAFAISSGMPISLDDVGENIRVLNGFFRLKPEYRIKSKKTRLTFSPSAAVLI